MKRHLPSAIARSALALFAVATFATAALAQSNRVVLVEEHWELKLTTPDFERSAPQITMVMSPAANIDGLHFLFTINHLTVPDYQPGGMQVQLWNHDELVEDSVADSSGSFEHQDETIRWVQRLWLDDGVLNFQVREGSSETWNTFGGDDLTLHTTTQLNSLNKYRPAVSLAESQVGYAENRVNSLTLTKLVWVTDDGEVHEQNAPIPIDTSLDN